MERFLALFLYAIVVFTIILKIMDWVILKLSTKKIKIDQSSPLERENAFKKQSSVDNNKNQQQQKSKKANKNIFQSRTDIPKSQINSPIVNQSQQIINQALNQPKNSQMAEQIFQPPDQANNISNPFHHFNNFSQSVNQLKITETNPFNSLATAMSKQQNIDKIFMLNRENIEKEEKSLKNQQKALTKLKEQYQSLEQFQKEIIGFQQQLDEYNHDQNPNILQEKKTQRKIQNKNNNQIQKKQIKSQITPIDTLRKNIKDTPNYQEKEAQQLQKSVQNFSQIKLKIHKTQQADYLLDQSLGEFQNRHAVSTIQNKNNKKDADNNVPMVQLKSELQFCQKQLNQSYTTQMQLKQQINKITRQYQLQNTKLRQQIRSYQRTLKDVKLFQEKYRNLEQMYLQLKRQSQENLKKYKIAMRNQGNTSYKLSSSGISGSPYSEAPKKSSIHTPIKAQHLIYGIFPQCRFINDDQRHFIVRTLRKLIDLPNKTEQLYKLDKVHPQNPHQYIDSIPNLMLLIELTNGKVIGAFTQQPFSHSVISSKIQHSRACILDLTKQKIFPNKNKTKSITYDPSALIWGKDALTIRMDQPLILYSNLCSKNGSYWDGITPTEQLLGSQRIWQNINNYEIHRIDFI